MTYVYLIESVHQRQQHYVGLTHNLKQRLVDHNEGKSIHPRKFKPWNLVAYLGFADEHAAAKFEKYLKSGSGKIFSEKTLPPDRPAPAGHDAGLNMTPFPPIPFDRREFLAIMMAFPA